MSMSMPTSSGNANTASESKEAVGEVERDYLEMMVDHHFVAARMAEVCQNGSVRAELEERAATMQRKQSQEIDQMRAWLRDRFQVDKAPGLSDDDRAMIKDLEALSGHELEMAFLKMMIEHHGKAITMSKDVVAKVEHEDVAEFCQDLIDDQGRETAQMEQWLKAWHGDM
jgi:uncharacterized protein (DUF305 family)